MNPLDPLDAKFARKKAHTAGPERVGVRGELRVFFKSSGVNLIFSTSNTVIRPKT